MNERDFPKMVKQWDFCKQKKKKTNVLYKKKKKDFTLFATELNHLYALWRIEVCHMPHTSWKLYILTNIWMYNNKLSKLVTQWRH